MNASTQRGDHPMTDPDEDGGSLPVRRHRRPAAAGGLRTVPEFSDLVLACRHHPLRTVFVGGVLSSLWLAVAWSLTAPIYQAESLVRVRERQDVVFSAQNSSAVDASFFRSQEKLALSPPVLEAALSQPAVQAFAHHLPSHDRVDWLKQMLQVETQSGSEMMSITASHKSAGLAQAASNAVATAYVEEVTRRMAYDRQQREQKLEQVARDADKRLDELWDELNTVARSVGSDSSESLTIRDELQLQVYRDDARQLRAAQERGSELRRLLAEQEAMMDQELSGAGQVAELDALSESFLHKHPDVIAARERVQNLDLEIEQMRQVAARDDSPRLLHLVENRKACVRDLNRILAKRHSELLEQSRLKQRSKVEASLAKLQKQLEANLAEVDLLKSRMSDIDAGISRSDDKTGIQLDIYRHAVDRQTRLADSLWQSLQELRIEGQSQPRVALAGFAHLPEQANHSRQMKVAGAAGAAGWLLAIFAVGYVEWRSCRVRYSDDVTEHSAFPVFGADRSLGRWFGGTSTPPSGAGEAAARMMLRHEHDSAVSTLMVTSATPGEPRHWASVELAQAFCRFDRRALVIDCDFESPALGKMLGAEQHSGVLQCSGPGTDARNHIIPTDQKGIDFLPLGLRADEKAWVDPQILRKIIQALREDYHVIIVNGPAVMLSAESLLLAAQVDTVMFSVFIGTTRWNQLLASEQSVSESGTSIGGSILHRGKQPTPLKLDPARRGEASRSALDETAEIQLSHQLAEMQHDLRQAQSGPNTIGNASRRQEEPTT